MLVSSDSEYLNLPNVRLIEQALKNLKRCVSEHFEQEARFERVCVQWHQDWRSQFEQLRARIDGLEARLAPWMIEPTEGPRLARLAPQEEVA